MNFSFFSLSAFYLVRILCVRLMDIHIFRIRLEVLRLLCMRTENCATGINSLFHIIVSCHLWQMSYKVSFRMLLNRTILPKSSIQKSVFQMISAPQLFANIGMFRIGEFVMNRIFCWTFSCFSRVPYEIVIGLVFKSTTKDRIFLCCLHTKFSA